MALPSMLRPGRTRGSVANRDLWDPFSSLRGDIERMFEDFSRQGGWAPATGGLMAPRIDVSESEGELKIEAELPGVEEKDVEVVLANDRLTIRGEKKQETEEKKKDYHVVERSYGSFARTIALPFETEADKVKADFANGVLTVTVPKSPEVKAQEKKIRVGKG